MNTIRAIQTAAVPASVSPIAESHWETKWIMPDSAFDPAYERTNAALRRWVDGMEQALISGALRRVARA